MVGTRKGKQQAGANKRIETLVDKFDCVVACSSRSHKRAANANSSKRMKLSFKPESLHTRELETQMFPNCCKTNERNAHFEMRTSEQNEHDMQPETMGSSSWRYEVSLAMHSLGRQQEGRRGPRPRCSAAVSLTKIPKAMFNVRPKDGHQVCST